MTTPTREKVSLRAAIERKHAALIRQRVAQAKRQIKADAKKGLIPYNVRNFAHLHDFMDANDYGMSPDIDLPQMEWVGVINAIQNGIDAWIKDGGLTEATASNKGSAMLKKTTTRKTTKTARAPSLKAPRVSLGFHVELKDEEGDRVWVGSASKLLSDNDNDTALRKALMGLKSGRAVKYGGGAGPLWTIRRM